MNYKNSMKLMTSNFSFVWKQLAYNLVRLAIIAGLAVLVSNPIVKLLVQNGVAEKFANLWQIIYTDFASFLSELKSLIVLFASTISQNISSIWFSIVLFFLVTIIINNFLKNVGKFAMTDMAHNQFTSLNKQGFCHSIVSKFGQNAKYSITKVLLDIPFDVLKVLYVTVYCLSLDSLPLAIFGITALIILYTITFALQLSLYNAIAVEMISNRTNPFRAILKGYKCNKDFFRVFSNAIIIVLTIIISNVIVGIFSLGAGLLITLPASFVLVTIFELVSYYGNIGQRYYLSPTIIVDAKNENLNKQ